MVTKSTSAFYTASFVLAAGIIWQLIHILNLNAGMLVYTLDDAYIHLALAENIAKFHYGINLSEFSSPASSILWPFLLAPWMKLPYHYLVPFIYNVACSFGILYFEWKLLDYGFADNTSKFKTLFIGILLCFLLAVTNIVPLIFMGMEHSAQLLGVVAVLYAMVRELENKYSPALAIASIVFCSLIRYENISIALLACLFFFLQGHRRDAVVAGGIVFAAVAAFSLFLVLHGLPALPVSVLVKTGNLQQAVHPLARVYLLANTERGAFFALLMLFFAGLLFRPEFTKGRRLLSAIVCVALFLYLEYGHVNIYWTGEADPSYFQRYESYIWTFSILSFIYLLKDHLIAAFHFSKTMFIVLACCAEVLFCQKNNWDFRTTAEASNNIYEQQYQMHRFVVDYYQAPVAVNDIGYVGYSNNHYVLDLWGLSLKRAWRMRMYDGNAYWIDTLTQSYNTKLIMIYDYDFPKHPSYWKKVAELSLTRTRITPGGEMVSFYATDDSSAYEIRRKLQEFQQTLPNKEMLQIFDQGLEHKTL
jgi:hypothetical protein